MQSIQEIPASNIVSATPPGAAKPLVAPNMARTCQTTGLDIECNTAGNRFLCKPPSFDGTSSIKGFLRNFSEWKEVHHLCNLEAKVVLCSALRAEAKIYEETVKYSGPATYEDVCAALCSAFEGAAERFYNELMVLKRDPAE